MILYRKYSNDYNHDKRKRNSDMNAMLNESINGMPVIQVFNRGSADRGGIQSDEWRLCEEEMKKLINLESATGENLLESFRSLIFAILVYIFASSFLSDTQALSVRERCTSGRLYYPVFNRWITSSDS